MTTGENAVKVSMFIKENALMVYFIIEVTTHSCLTVCKQSKVGFYRTMNACVGLEMFLSSVMTCYCESTIYKSLMFNSCEDVSVFLCFLAEWLLNMTVNKLVVIIKSLISQEVLERWQFDVECDKSALTET